MANIITRDNSHKTVFSSEECSPVETADMILSKNAADLLEKHYSGHMWAVQVNSEGGVMYIKNFAISHSYGMVLHLKNVYQDPNLKSVIKAGGEYLERAHLNRGKWHGETASELEGAKEALKPRNGLIF